MTLCLVDGCTTPAKSRKWCGLHYQRWYRHGDPTALVAQPAGPMVHGTHRAYGRGRCRCDVCKAFMRQYMAQWRQGNRQRTLAPDDPAHGTPNGYENYGCRCFPCRLAKSKADAAYREKRAS